MNFDYILHLISPLVTAQEIRNVQSTIINAGMSTIKQEWMNIQSTKENALSKPFFFSLDFLSDLTNVFNTNLPNTGGWTSLVYVGENKKSVQTICSAL